MQVLYLGFQLLIDLHHRLYFHLRLDLHSLNHHLQLRLPLLRLPNPLLVSFSLSLALHILLLQLNFSIGPLV